MKASADACARLLRQMLTKACRNGEEVLRAHVRNGRHDVVLGLTAL